MADYSIPDPERALAVQFAELWAAIRALQQPTGTSIAALIERVEDALQNIAAQVAFEIGQSSYTKAQIDAKVIAPPTLTVAGVTRLVHAASNAFASGSWVSTYTKTNAGEEGQIGYAPSTRASKNLIEPFEVDDPGAFLVALQPWLFAYKDDPEQTERVGLIAEDVAKVFPAATFNDADGNLAGINYEMLAVAALAAGRALALNAAQRHGEVEQLRATVAALTARLDALEAL